MKAPYIYDLDIALVSDISDELLEEAIRNTGESLPGYKKFLKKIAHSGNRLSLRVCMPLSDGKGVMSILLSLAAEYIRLHFGSEIDCGKWVIDPSVAPDPEEDNFNGFTGKMLLRHGLVRRKRASRDNFGHIDLPKGMTAYITSIACG